MSDPMYSYSSSTRAMVLFDAAIELLAHKDITPAHAVRLAVEVEGYVTEACDVEDEDDPVPVYPMDANEIDGDNVRAYPVDAANRHKYLSRDPAQLDIERKHPF
jgi:hypothetical protein